MKHREFVVVLMTRMLIRLEELKTHRSSILAVPFYMFVVYEYNAVCRITLDYFVCYELCIVNLGWCMCLCTKSSIVVLLNLILQLLAPPAFFYNTRNYCLSLRNLFSNPMRYDKRG